VINNYILDTDTCIYWLRGNENIEKNIIARGLNNIFMTVITECELYYGAFKSAQKEKNMAVLHELGRRIHTLHTGEGIAYHYGRIKSALESKGARLDDADLLIACMALEQQATLVTNNTKHFGRIPGLLIESWK
jgi:tRNA(fMet)-specific endonuclease VapC